MKIHIDVGYRIDKKDPNCKPDPYALVDLDISTDELKDIKERDTELYFFLTKMMQRALSEADKGIQVF